MKARLRAAASNRTVVLTLQEWKTDTSVSTALYYDISIQVWSPDGERVAEQVFRGKDDLGGNFLDPVGHARTAVPGERRRGWTRC